MSAPKLDVNPIIDAIPGRELPQNVKYAAYGGIGWGVFAFLYGGFMSDGGWAWAWGAFLVALVYTLAITQGGVMLSVILTGTWGRWGRPLKRIGEALAFFMPVVYVLLLIFLLLGNTIYVWNPATIIPGGPVDLAPHSPEAFASKPFWLQTWFFIARQLFAVGLLFGLNFVYLRHSLRPDLIMAKARLGSGTPAWWDRIIGGETNLEKAIEEGQNGQSFWFTFLAWAYALVFSFLAFDLVMSLSPWWYSNMFGGWMFVSSVWLSLCVIGIVSMLGLDWLGMRDWIKPEVTHDLGKLMLAFCMFWAYTSFAQLLPIWYTDMPEETDFLLVRMYLPQWSWLASLVGITCFVAPFTILLSRGIKKMRYPFAGICALIMVGLFLERSLLVMPSVYFGDTFPFGDFVIVNVGLLAGFLSLMVLVVGKYLSEMPVLVISDPYLEPHPWDVHVHSLDAQH